MPYVLGIDIGASHTVAAACRLDDPAADDVKIVRLGERSDTVESVLHLERDGSLVVGQSTGLDHRRVARGFVERIGDGVPMVVGGLQYRPQDLTAAVVGWVIDQAGREYGAAPEHVVVAHPAGWGPYRRGLLHGALRQFGLDGVTLLPRPVVAAERHRATVADGLVAVHDLGAEPPEASVVSCQRGPFQLLGTAEAGAPQQSVDTLIRSAADPSRLGAVLLVGGSSPAEQVGARLPARVVVDAEPRLTVARGAALAARRVVRPVLQPQPLAAELPERRSMGRSMPPPRPPVEVSPLRLPERRSMGRSISARPAIAGALASAVAAAGLALTLAFFADGRADRSSTNPPTTSNPTVLGPGSAVGGGSR